MRTFIFALAAIVPAFAIDRAGAADEPPAFDIARNCAEETAGSAIGGPRPARKTKQMPKTSWPNAGLPIARHRKKNASARAAPEARRATSSF
jgi:hypothetical protein